MILSMLAAQVLLNIVPVANAALDVTIELIPARPVVGQSAEVILRTWLPGESYTPVEIDPSYPFSIRAYRAETFSSHFVSATDGIPIAVRPSGQIEWHGYVTFPEAGHWVIVCRNFYPPLTVVPPPPDSTRPATLEVEVLSNPRFIPDWRLVFAIALLLIPVTIWVRRRRRHMLP